MGSKLGSNSRSLTNILDDIIDEEARPEGEQKNFKVSCLEDF
jgi:hypothetical protein